MKTSSEGRLEEAGSDSGAGAAAAGGGDAPSSGTGGVRGKVKLGELNKAKSSSTSQLSQTGKLCCITLTSKKKEAVSCVILLTSVVAVFVLPGFQATLKSKDTLHQAKLFLNDCHVSLAEDVRTKGDRK
jgi:hypothetical protein